MSRHGPRGRSPRRSPTRTPASKPFKGLTATRIRVGNRTLRVVVADQNDERIQGLRRRADIGPYKGMLFVFDAPTGHVVHDVDGEDAARHRLLRPSRTRRRPAADAAVPVDLRSAVRAVPTLGVVQLRARDAPRRSATRAPRHQPADRCHTSVVGSSAKGARAAPAGSLTLRQLESCSFGRPAPCGPRPREPGGSASVRRTGRAPRSEGGTADAAVRGHGHLRRGPGRRARSAPPSSSHASSSRPRAPSSVRSISGASVASPTGSSTVGRATTWSSRREAEPDAMDELGRALLLPGRGSSPQGAAHPGGDLREARHAGGAVIGRGPSPALQEVKRWPTTP